MENYTLTFILGKENKNGLCKIYLRYYSKSLDTTLFDKTIRIDKKEFQQHNIKSPVSKSNPNHLIYNTSLNNFRITVEGRIAAAQIITKEILSGETSSSDRLVDFIEDNVSQYRKENEKSKGITERGMKRAKGTLSEGRLKLYEVLRNKVMSFDSKVTFKHINTDWLKRFEAFIKLEISQNTLSTNMTVLVAILNRAAEYNYLSSATYKTYSIPSYENQIPEYLEEEEVEAFYKVVRSCADNETKTSGYYFLLGCYAGYRISDLYSFNYEDRVKGSKLILRAKKNGTIVSIPIYPRLQEILEYVRYNKIGITEEHMRKKVKVLASLAGISGRNIKVHTARHTFGMMFTEKGFSIEEVAEMLGDSVNVARIYARITNKHLHNRILNTMGG